MTASAFPITSAAVHFCTRGGCSLHCKHVASFSAFSDGPLERHTTNGANVTRLCTLPTRVCVAFTGSSLKQQDSTRTISQRLVIDRHVNSRPSLTCKGLVTPWKYTLSNSLAVLSRSKSLLFMTPNWFLLKSRAFPIVCDPCNPTKHYCQLTDSYEAAPAANSAALFSPLAPAAPQKSDNCRALDTHARLCRHSTAKS